MTQKNIFIVVAIMVVLILGYSFLLWMRPGFIDHQPQVSPALSTSSSQSSTPTQPPQLSPASSANDVAWNALVNEYGWSIKYPSSWEAYGMHDNTAEEEEGPIIQGPKNCFDGGLRCGTIQIDSMGERTIAEFSNLTPKQYLFEYRLKYLAGKLLAQRALQVGGESAYEITFLQTNAGGYPNGQVAKTIAINHKGVMYTIGYYEDFKDRSAIKSADDWTLTTLFEQIISTFRFTN